MFITQISASRVTTDLLKCLKDTGWTDRETMSYANVRKYTELLQYIIMLDDKIHKSTLSFEFSPQATLHFIVPKLKTKVEEKHSTENLASTPVAVVQQKDADTEASASSVATTVKAKPKYYCSYCQRDAHTVGRCFQCIRGQ